MTSGSKKSRMITGLQNKEEYMKKLFEDTE
jgi:hypothetical protein